MIEPSWLINRSKIIHTVTVIVVQKYDIYSTKIWAKIRRTYQQKQAHNRDRATDNDNVVTITTPTVSVGNDRQINEMTDNRKA